MFRNTLFVLFLGIVGVKGAAAPSAGAAAGSGRRSIAKSLEPIIEDEVYQAYQAYHKAIDRLTDAEFREIVDYFSNFNSLFERELPELQEFHYDITDALLDFNLKIISYIERIENLTKERVRLNYIANYKIDGGSTDVENDPRIKSIRENCDSMIRNFGNFKKTLNDSVREKFSKIEIISPYISSLSCWTYRFPLDKELDSNILRINSKFKNLLLLKKNLDKLSQSSSSEG